MHTVDVCLALLKCPPPRTLAISRLSIIISFSCACPLQDLPLEKTALQYVEDVARADDPRVTMEKCRAALGALGLVGTMALQKIGGSLTDYICHVADLLSYFAPPFGPCRRAHVRMCLSGVMIVCVHASVCVVLCRCVEWW